MGFFFCIKWGGFSYISGGFHQCSNVPLHALVLSFGSIFSLFTWLKKNWNKTKTKTMD